jgi:hypothetical protein
MRDGRMHQTTVRFGPDLWEALEAECARLGISAAQYVREAALARLAFTAGRLGGEEYAGALVTAGAPALAEVVAAHDAAPGPTPFGVGVEAVTGRARQTVAASSENQLDALAVTAQNQLVVRRAQEIRAQSQQLRRHKVAASTP